MKEIITLLSSEAIEKLEAEINRQAKRRQAEPKTKLGSLKNRITHLDHKIKKGAGRLLLVDEADFAEASAVLAEWRLEREQLKNQLAVANCESRVAPKDLAKRAIAKIESIAECIRSADVELAHETMCEIFESVTLWWEPNKRGGRRPLKKGIINLKRDSQVATLAAAP